MTKKIIFTLVIFLININVFALSYQGCDYALISRLKSVIGNVNIITEYYEENGTIYFKNTITNIIEDIYFIDDYTNTKYTYGNTNNGEIVISGYNTSSGKYKFYSNASGCVGTYLGVKYYKFPIYNIYFNDPICNDIKEYPLCKKWVNKLYSYNEFNKKVEDYKESLNKQDSNKETQTYKKDFFSIIGEFYSKYYYYFLEAIILVCLVIIIVKSKKDKFKF